MQHLPISFSHVPVFLPSTPSQVLSLLSPLSLCLSLPPTKLLLASLFSSSPSHLPSLISPPPVPEPGLLPSLPHIKLPLELSLLDPYLPRLVTKEHIPLLTNMSGRRNRSRQRQSSSSRITDEQINDLVSKLQALLPEAGIRSNNSVGFIRILPTLYVLPAHLLLFPLMPFECRFRRPGSCKTPVTTSGPCIEKSTT